MLTYMSTLRSRTGFFLVRPKNAYFANSPTAAIAFAFAPASIIVVLQIASKNQREALHRLFLNLGQKKAKILQIY